MKRTKEGKKNVALPYGGKRTELTNVRIAFANNYLLRYVSDCTPSENKIMKKPFQVKKPQQQKVLCTTELLEKR